MNKIIMFLFRISRTRFNFTLFAILFWIMAVAFIFERHVWQALASLALAFASLFLAWLFAEHYRR